MQSGKHKEYMQRVFRFVEKLFFLDFNNLLKSGKIFYRHEIEEQLT